MFLQSTLISRKEEKKTKIMRNQRIEVKPTKMEKKKPNQEKKLNKAKKNQKS